MKRFDVMKVQGPCQDARGKELPKEKFVSERLKRSLAESGSVQKKWKVMRDAMCEVGRSVLS